MTLFDFAWPTPDESDHELHRVHQYLLGRDPDGRIFSKVLRETIDQLLDGEHTGRYDWEDLHKTEKTHAGTLIEINLQRAFNFCDGQDMDYLIGDVEVDCKFSQKLYGWMIPPEALDEICLVVWADDHASRWSAGLLRADRVKLTQSNGVTKRGNRDHKFQLTKQHRDLVYWLWHDVPLKENLLLHLDSEVRAAIEAPSSGQQRVIELFRQVQQRRIDRSVVRTLARQHDYMARVRDGKGRARGVLAAEGIIIAGDYKNHQLIAASLGGPVPEKGEFVSFRVSRMGQHHGNRRYAMLDGEAWVVSQAGDPVEPAPKLPAAQGGDN